jgi:hypothetical protein
MANEVLNHVALAEAARRPGCLVRSIGWGPWDGGMVTPTLRGHFQAQGIALIKGAEGAGAFMAELREGGSDVQLVVGAGEPRELLARDTGHRGAITAEVLINPERYPFLASHCIGADPVVPVVLVAEWFMQAAMALIPGSGIPTLRELRVLRGIVLHHWGRCDTRLRITARFEPGAKQQLRCELHSGDGKELHYTATADFSDLDEPPKAASPAPALQACDVAGSTLYGTPALFHGPDLRAIRRLTGRSDRAVSAELFSATDLGWERRDSLLDVAAVDGGLQVALAWLFQVSGCAMLPTQLGAIRLSHHTAPARPITCWLELNSANTMQAICEIVIQAGAWTVRMSGTQLHARVTAPAQTVDG